MTTAISGTGEIGSVIARQLASGGETLRPRAPAMSRHEGWLHRSVAPRSPPSETATRCRAPVPSSSRCALPC